MSVRQYLSYTKRERIGVLTLIALLLIIAFLPHFIPRKKPLVEDIPVREEKGVDSSSLNGYDSTRMRYHENYYHDNSRYNNDENRGYGYYNRDSRYFNNYTGRPYHNTYRKKYYSDTIYQKEAYYGDKYQSNYSEKKSFVRGDEHQTPREYTGQYASHRWSRYSPTIVDINTGDTAAFIALPGIGSKLAGRIVSFREKLGGFSSVDQIREVYGLRDSVFMKLLPYLKCDSMYMRRPLVSYSTSR